MAVGWFAVSHDRHKGKKSSFRIGIPNISLLDAQALAGDLPSAFLASKKRRMQLVPIALVHYLAAW